MKTSRTSSWPALCAAFLLAAAGFAQAQGLPPGEYLAEGGAGVLRIDPAAGGTQKFKIINYGSNGHACEAQGPIRGTTARLPTEDKAPPCTIKFTAKGESVDAVAESDSCQFFCGMRASLGGTFLKPPPGCGLAEVRKTRSAFKQQFDKKDFAQAKALLQPVADKCFKLMGEVDEGWIRNDLALTYLRLNDKAGCLKLLEPFRKLGAMNEKQIAEDYLPVDAMERVPVARATRTNLRLCGAK